MEITPDEPEPSLALLLQLTELSTPYLVFNVLAFVLLIISSALISGSEVAFFSLDSNQLSELEKEQSVTSNSVLKLLSRRRYLLATILILNNLVNIAIVTISTFFTWAIVGTKTTEGIVVVALSAVVTFVILFFGEVVPKNFANQHNEKFARFTSRALVFLEKIFRPASWTLITVTNIIERNVEKKGS